MSQSELRCYYVQRRRYLQPGAFGYVLLAESRITSLDCVCAFSIALYSAAGDREVNLTTLALHRPWKLQLASDWRSCHDRGGRDNTTPDASNVNPTKEMTSQIKTGDAFAVNATEFEAGANIWETLASINRN